MVWTSVGQDGALTGAFGQSFDSAGVKVGTEFQANTHTAAGQFLPAVAIEPARDFVVVWTGGGGQDGAMTGIFGQRFAFGTGGPTATPTSTPTSDAHRNRSRRHRARR